MNCLENFLWHIKADIEGSFLSALRAMDSIHLRRNLTAASRDKNIPRRYKYISKRWLTGLKHDFLPILIRVDLVVHRYIVHPASSIASINVYDLFPISNIVCLRQPRWRAGVIRNVSVFLISNQRSISGRRSRIAKGCNNHSLTKSHRTRSTLEKTKLPAKSLRAFRHVTDLKE